jgi:thioredoxin reductase (NADPH)
MTNTQSADDSTAVKVFGTSGEARSYAIRDFLTRGDVPFEWIELNNEQQAGLSGSAI